MLLCYITDRSQFPGDEAARRRSLLAKIEEAARCGVNYIQLREKDLPARDLEQLAREALHRIHAVNSATALLIKSRTDVAIAAGASGVHLRADDVSPEDVRGIYKSCGVGAPARARPVIGVSCHTVERVARAAAQQATFAVFGPVFEKTGTAKIFPTGLDGLREACQQKIPVLALGGITPENARSCIAAGAAGIAAIRLFQENDIAEAARATCL